MNKRKLKFKDLESQKEARQINQIAFEMKCSPKLVKEEWDKMKASTEREFNPCSKEYFPKDYYTIRPTIVSIPEEYIRYMKEWIESHEEQDSSRNRW